MKTKATLKTLYLNYPYKWYNKLSNTVPGPYFPASDISEHEFKMTCTNWTILAKMYLEEVENKLLRGDTVDLGRLGILILHKRKGVAINKRKTIDSKAETGEVTKYYHHNNHTNGYKPYFKWHRQSTVGCQLPLKAFFMCNLIRNTTWKRISKKLHSDPSIINNLRDYNGFVPTVKNSSEPITTNSN